MRDFTETNIEYPTALTSNLAMNSSPGGLKPDWLARLQEVQEGAEQEEKELTYLSSWGVEKDRKRTGSDYTPVDVATYFWNEFFFLNDLDSPNDTLQFFRARKFVEPSVGAGTLFLAYPVNAHDRHMLGAATLPSKARHRLEQRCRPRCRAMSGRR